MNDTANKIQQLEDDLGGQFWPQVSTILTSKVMNKLEFRIEKQIEDQIKEQVGDQVEEQAGPQG